MCCVQRSQISGSLCQVPAWVFSLHDQVGLSLSPSFLLLFGSYCFLYSSLTFFLYMTR